LLPGNYTVRAEANGFKTSDHPGILLEVGKDFRADVVLQPGEQTQTITVTEALPMVETTNATLGGTVSNEVINDLPMNGRDYKNLLVLIPGVTAYPGGGALRLGHAKSGFPGSQQWFTPMVYAAASATVTTYTMVAGDMFAWPFFITEETENWDMFQIEALNASTSSATVRFAIYDDEALNGYPRINISEPLGAVFTVTNTAALKPTSAFNIAPDFGLYWPCMKVETNGGTTAMQLRAYSTGPAYGVPTLNAFFNLETLRGVGIERHDERELDDRS